MPIPSLAKLKKKSRRIRPAGKYADVKIIPQPHHRRDSQVRYLDADLSEESEQPKKRPAEKNKAKS